MNEWIEGDWAYMTNALMGEGSRYGPYPRPGPVLFHSFPLYAAYQPFPEVRSRWACRALGVDLFSGSGEHLAGHYAPQYTVSEIFPDFQYRTQWMDDLPEKHGSWSIYWAINDALLFGRGRGTV